LEAAHGSLSMTKNGLPRDVPLSTKALPALEGVDRSTDRVFAGLTSDTLKHNFARLVKRCKSTSMVFATRRSPDTPGRAEPDSACGDQRTQGHPHVGAIYAPEGRGVG
jgi:hypothetical protein